ncbi:CAP domain-containing protein [Frankia sp. B2]|nr:CAP domain-containing protein [Frankia sp. B2]
MLRQHGRHHAGRRRAGPVLCSAAGALTAVLTVVLLAGGHSAPRDGDRLAGRAGTQPDRGVVGVAAGVPPTSIAGRIADRGAPTGPGAEPPPTARPAGPDQLAAARAAALALAAPVTAPSASAPAVASPHPPYLPASWMSLVGQVATSTNFERRAAGCPPLIVDLRLAAAAQAHSVDMATVGYFGHGSPDGRSPFDRIAAAGFSFSIAAENIAAGQRTVAEVMRGWMNSPEHRSNILTCSLTRIGVGYATGGRYGTYWTQDFGTP